MLSNLELEKLFEDIFLGIVTLTKLPENLYLEIADKLVSGVYKGYGSSLSKYKVGSPNYKILNKLRTNIYQFSAAKTYQETKNIQNFIFDKKGYKRQFNDFKKDAIKVDKLFNNSYLKAEFNTTISQADSASKWGKIQKDKEVLPLLKFSTVGDARVQAEHQALDGQIHPVDDKFWSDYMPPLNFNCRCTVIQIADGKVSASSNFFEPPKLFKNNPGKTDEIFNKTHPYYSSVDKKTKEKNFGLKIPKP